MASERIERTYRLEPLDSSGIFLGLGAVQDLTEHDHGVGRLGPDDAAEHPRVAAARVDAEVDEWDAVMAANLRGPFLGTRAALRHFIKTGTTGSIVITASIASLRGAADLLAYTTSKHGVTGLVHGAAVYAGPIGVRVNAVAPGIVPTPIFGEAGIQDMKKRASTSPLRRAGEPDEVASAVAYLLSDDASYITGAVLSVDGGASVQNTNRWGGGAGLWDTASVDATILEAFRAE